MSSRSQVPFVSSLGSNSPLVGLEPARVWSHFDRIRRIPRPSKREERIADEVLAWAEQHGFPFSQDEAGNLLIRVDAAPGLEQAPVIVLQAHLDMVCEKNEGVAHDFDRDGIRVRVDGDWVEAEGTTLGADNGIGMALAMAAAVDPELRCGPLELLFTRDEETGLNGARALDGSRVRGRTMINLDAEAEDSLYIGCAGAAGVRAWVPLDRQDQSSGEPWTLAVRGLKGGHSGVDIDRGRGNAISLLARILVAGLDRGLDLGLVGLHGGDKVNAIPREAFAELALGSGVVEAWRSSIDSLAPSLREQLGAAGAGLSVEIEPAKAPFAESPLTEVAAARWLRLLDALPHGPVSMSKQVSGLVETSANLALAQIRGDQGEITLSLRSSSDPALDGLGQSIASLCSLAGARVERIAGYSGWQPEPESKLVRRTSRVYESLFGAAPRVRAVHAGLECGVIARRVPGLKAVSFGPSIHGAHSPDERVSISSVGKIYRWLGALLGELATD